MKGIVRAVLAFAVLMWSVVVLVTPVWLLKRMLLELM